MHELVGRSREVQFVRSALKRTLEGARECVVVEGPSGVGKSCLLDAAVEQAAKLGMATAVGCATELDRAVPLTTLLCALRDENAPGLIPADLKRLDAQRLGTVDLLRERIVQYAERRGLLIAIDDAHMADEFTALAIRLLVPATASARVMWLITRRSTPAHGVVQDTIDRLIEHNARRLQLGPFDGETIARFCTLVLGAEPHPDILALASRTEGDPSLLAVLLAGLRDTDRVHLSDGVACLRLGNLPPAFLDSVDRRLHVLSPEARHLLDTASVFARPFTVHEIAILQKRPVTDLFRGVREAVQAGALLEYGSGLVFQQDLVREAIHERLAAPLRVALHREVVRVLVAGRAEPGEIVRHVVQAGWSGDELVTQLREGIDRGVKAPSGLLVDIVRLLLSTGNLREVRDFLDCFLDDVEARRLACLLLELAEAATLAGEDIDLYDLTSRALDRQDISEPVRAQMHIVCAHGLLQTGDTDAADRLASAAMESGLRAGEPNYRVMGTVARSVAASAEGRLTDALKHAQEAVYVSETDASETEWHQPQLWLARSLITCDRFEEAEAVLDAIDLRGPAWSKALRQYSRAVLRMAAGRLDEATVELKVIPVAEQFQVCHARPLALLGHIALVRRDIRAAQHHLRLAERLVAGDRYQAPEVSWRLALLHDAEQRPQEALAAAADLYEKLPLTPLVLVEAPEAAVELTRIALRAGARPQAEIVVSAIRRLRQRNPYVPSIAGAAAHAEGLLHDDPTALRAAVDAYRDSPRALAKTMAMEDAAKAEAGREHRPEATAPRQKALDRYAVAGKIYEPGRQDAPARTPAASTRARDGLGSLTEAELRVVALVAEGLTNREVAGRLYLSPHTVDSHLRSSFAKLGVSSRVQLTREFVLSKDNYPEKT
ncbi:AAA family ATPase [Nonomuraea typhae]|uniref:AAA family ATPase n=1 Tax=Nonomuraea typhae TaxID=2603600 RepID=A0ABW7YQ47_9ACTN